MDLEDEVVRGWTEPLTPITGGSGSEWRMKAGREEQEDGVHADDSGDTPG